MKNSNKLYHIFDFDLELPGYFKFTGLYTI